MKHMASNFVKLDKFEGVDFRRWQKKMHFLLCSMSVVYVLTTPMPEDGGDDATVKQIRKRAKWDNDDYVCRDSLEAKYMIEDASNKKFLVSNFTNYKMTDSRQQYNELLGILGRFTQQKMNMDEAIQVSCIIDKLPPSWKDFKHTLKHKKEELTLVELRSHLRIEDSLRMQDSDKPKGNNIAGPSVVNMVEHNNLSMYNDNKGATVHVCKDRYWFKTYESLNDGSILHMGNESWVWGCMVVVRLPDPKLKTLSERGIECIFAGYVEHSKAFRFFVIEPIESVSINSIIESKDAIFDENKFSSVPRPNLRISNRTEVIGGLVVPEENEVSNQHSYCFDVEDDPKTFDEAMKSQDVLNFLFANGSSKENLRIIHQMNVMTAFLNGELDEEVYMNQPRSLSFIMPGNENKVDLTKEFLSSRFSMKDMWEADVILVSTHMDTSEKLMPNNGQVVSHLSNPWLVQAIQRVLKYLKKTIDYRLTYTGYPSVLEGYTDASWISNIKDNSSTSGWVFLLGGGAISWASKKQTCITGSTMKSKFVALAAAGKEAEWLKNLLLEIPLWSKPITPISIRCDSAATLAKDYSQMYNGMSRHLGVRHNMIRELITNGVVSIEFVRSQRNLTNHLTKELARDLVLKSAEGMGLKSNLVTEC
ncbi:zinc finger, CCHC-type containing protein [Tanacetum coccineum]